VAFGGSLDGAIKANRQLTVHYPPPPPPFPPFLRIQTIEQADNELDHQTSRANQRKFGFFSRKFDKKGRPKGRSNSVPPRRRSAGSGGGVGELDFKPQSPQSAGGNADMFDTR